jgi:mannose-6-phosphate isomerase-like protein (cupin superfamily)
MEDKPRANELKSYTHNQFWFVISGQMQIY